MALFEAAYTPPGVYTTVIQDVDSATLSTNARIPVFIGEGTEFFTDTNIAMQRGSSSSADQAVTENISDQVTGLNNSFQLSYFPVVTGNGSGTVTNTPSYVQIVATLPGNTSGVPQTIASLVGKTGVVVLADLVPEGTSLTATYYFKKTDTLITNENDSFQVPTFANLAFQGTGAFLTVSIPGTVGNEVTVAFTQAASGDGVPDALAITGNGTNTISIEIRNSDNTLRTLEHLSLLISAGVQTLSAGFLSLSGTLNSGQQATVATAAAAASLTGGTGPNTNTVFQVQNVPIVDGTNGGVVTNSPSFVTATVNGTAVSVSAVDGLQGLVTLAQGVAAGAQLLITYYTNTYQSTSDMLPSLNVSSIARVGLGPGRSDFTQGVDYLLSGNNIAWGAAAETSAGVNTPGFAPFNASAINTTLVDEYVYLQPVSGLVNGQNTVFVLNDAPVDGSGLNVVTDDVSLVQLYTGSTALAAFAAGPIGVLRLSGKTATVTTINPPPAGGQVFASYRRSVLNDHTFTVAVVEASGPGAGSFTITDEANLIAPSVTVGAASVAAANFRNTGIVFPNNFPDLTAAIGAANEVVTLTFQNDSLTKTVSPATQASLTVEDSSAIARITFRATTPGVSGNLVTVSLVGGPTGAANASAIVTATDAITVATVMADNVTTRTWQEIVDLFVTYPPTTTDGGVILCTGVTGADLTSQATATSVTHLAGGAAAVTTSYANRFLVTSSRTTQQAAIDGLGLTGGATTPVMPNTTLGATGYLGQTYIDPNTGVVFTIVDPTTALSYGFTNLPSPSYSYLAGDILTFIVSESTPIPVGSTPTIAIPGLRTQIPTTSGMNVGDTAIIQTFNNSGDQPNVGETYYVTYTTAKQASDYGLQTWDSAADAYAVYGLPDVPANRLSIAISLFVQNGGQQFATIQVPVQQGTTLASDDSFIAAVQSLTIPFAGTNQFPDVIQVLSTSANVQQTLSRFLITQAAPLAQAEAISFIGFSQYTTPTQIAQTAQAIASERVIAVSVVAAGISLQGPTDLVATTFAFSGEFVAAALCGLYCNPANDVATTLTGQNVVGFTRNLLPIDPPTMNALAAAGVTVLIDIAGALQVRHYKTTNPANALTSEPYVTTISDFISQSFRSNLSQFKGRKMTSDLPSSISAVGNSLLAGWNNSLITAYTPVVVVQDANDPTTYDVSFSFRPMFSLLYVNITITVNLSQ
jgi:hypothetical protein